jgi:hypothetical protein
MAANRHTILTPAERTRRQEAFRKALAQVRLEGLEPDPVIFDYADRYSRGELTIEEAVAEFTARVTRSAAAR